MIISRGWAKKLIRDGRAVAAGIVAVSIGGCWLIVDRLDLSRTDHVRLSDEETGVDWGVPV